MDTYVPLLLALIAIILFLVLNVVVDKYAERKRFQKYDRMYKNLAKKDAEIQKNLKALDNLEDC